MNEYRSLIRVRIGLEHAHYGGGLVDGAFVCKLFGDAATEVLIHSDGDEGLFRAYQNLEFLAHGMGMVSHEAPRLTDRGPVPYPADDADRPLEAGAVISVETTLKHPQRGFIKLEDTVVVTDEGCEIYAEGGRSWMRGGTADGG